MVDQLSIETDSSVKAAIAYAFAVHGDKAALECLITTLSTRPNLAFSYLRLLSRATGRYHSDVESLKQWASGISRDDFAKLMEEQQSTQRKRETDFDRFVELSLYRRHALPATDVFSGQGQVFSLDFYAEKPNPPEMTPEERRELAELPTKNAWQLFAGGMQALQAGERSKAAILPGRVSSEYSTTAYYHTASEVAQQLKAMVEEDGEFVDAQRMDNDLPLRQRIAFHVHNLRDAKWSRSFGPTWSTWSFTKESRPTDDKYFADTELLKLGASAVPDLISLLSDRRPTRSVWFGNVGGERYPSAGVLCYDEVAFQILVEIVPNSPHLKKGTYLFQKTPGEIERLLDSLMGYM